MRMEPFQRSAEFECKASSEEPDCRITTSIQVAKEWGKGQVQVNGCTE